MMSPTLNPGSSEHLIRDAHYHPIRAAATWRLFVAGMHDLAIADPEERARRDEQRRRETTYARGELGGH